MTIRRRFLLASSLARLIQREKGGLHQIEGFFPEQKDRTSWVRLDEARALLILRTAGPYGDVEEHTEVPASHAQALLARLWPIFGWRGAGDEAGVAAR
ncbi:hypothetical protein JKG68_20230 [Microvirga aerilata]|uniref:Uncharacterized protein n=1 Tax=Microvirga aerilata TaxID=670292 RepID=A0A937D0V3_9HYPH|nr:hypothetical protein [Microvirga aerilata]MBL0406291.1 hypothetical protein [Microvirga aerilata]